MRMLTWYLSWFRASGTLDVEGYAKHIGAAFASFFGFGILGVAMSLPLLPKVFAWQLPVLLAILSRLVLALLAVGSRVGIFVTSTIRFLRHQVQIRHSHHRADINE
jgi:hypothetical protein